MDAAALKTGEDFKRLSAQGMSAAEISAQCGIPGGGCRYPEYERIKNHTIPAGAPSDPPATLSGFGLI